MPAIGEKREHIVVPRRKGSQASTSPRQLQVEDGGWGARTARPFRRKRDTFTAELVQSAKFLELKPTVL